ncbi:hypothetical protein I6A84_35950 [Frankia sp. CNm7]|uniref:hypothetical protein n=1 Tax=Frankia nepalensis TaxID=1836974 RepID=UPI001932CE7E|nr:hypothetical protein [Frankia nepalensis]MBL7523335.1 hypothetical protein [Frankia nepalensis]
MHEAAAHHTPTATGPGAVRGLGPRRAAGARAAGRRAAGGGGAPPAPRPGGGPPPTVAPVPTDTAGAIPTDSGRLGPNSPPVTTRGNRPEVIIVGGPNRNDTNPANPGQLLPPDGDPDGTYRYCPVLYLDRLAGELPEDISITAMNSDSPFALIASRATLRACYPSTLNSGPLPTSELDRLQVPACAAGAALREVEDLGPACWLGVELAGPTPTERVEGQVVITYRATCVTTTAQGCDDPKVVDRQPSRANPITISWSDSATYNAGQTDDTGDGTGDGSTDGGDVDGGSTDDGSVSPAVRSIS